MSRFVAKGAFVFTLALVGVGCGAKTALGPAPDPKAATAQVRSACETAPDPSPACLDALTRPQVESRQEVAAAEAAREAEVFRGRLAELRAAEEQRQTRRRRVRTTTAAVAQLLQRPDRTRRAPPANPMDTLDRIDAPGLLDEPDPPESARASAPSAEDSAEAPSGETPASIRKGPAPAGRAASPTVTTATQAPASAAATAGDGPTPELYLRAGRCLLTEDQRQGWGALKAYRRRREADRDQAGRWALALTDASALQQRVESEMDHRKLAKPGPVCMSSSVRPVVALLRSLVGPAPSTAQWSDAFGRGLLRLDRELQIRAGLPPAE